uniref:Uncharacterized protein n=1 Tax=Cannabis sativa TaxID=3483 RepID=A0A803P938_CANSA
MAAGNVCVVASRILEFLNSDDKVKEIESVYGADKKFLQGLKGSIQDLDSVILDAETKSQSDNGIKDWLMELEDVLYSADNLLHSFYTEARHPRKKLSSAKKKNMLLKINQVKEELIKIGEQRKLFDFKEEIRSEELVVVGKDIRLEKNESGSSSSSMESTLRNEDKAEIIRILLHVGEVEVMEVLPLVGRVGSGKTRLAEEVFNDEVIKCNFEPRIWISVSGIFDVEQILGRILSKITGKIVEDLPSNKKSQDVVLGKSLNGKKYLIVLDDVQNEEPEKWKSLTDSLKVGAIGSKMLVTTRSETVSNLIKGRIRPYLLKDLSDEKYLFLFGKIAFGGREIEARQIRVGMEIVRRCAGRPLAIKATAAMLRSKSAEEWRTFYKREFSKIGESHHDMLPFGFLSSTNDHREMLSLLKLCYDDLPSCLKHCFAYCSLFPKGYVINVQKLIKLWMAQGFIVEQLGKSQEDVGYEYFLSLLGGYFFEEVERDNSTGKMTKCKMHNFMHDLAMLVTDHQCVLFSSADDYVDISRRRTFHVWFDFDLSSTEFITLLDVKKIRTIVLSGQSRSRYGGLHVNRFFDKICSQFKYLRALDMHDSGIEVVSDSISKLKLLEYLDLSENEDITELPNSITLLLNLQTLRLSSCFKLKRLPEDFSNLINLQHLEIDGCNNLTNLPRGISKVQDLEALSQLVVSEGSLMPNVVEKKLQELSKLPIRNLRLVLRHEKHVIPYLQAVPQGIRSLSLETEGYNLESVSEEETHINKNLSSDLEELSINAFKSPTLFCPKSYFPGKLVKLSLRRCANFKSLPAVELSSLKVLVLDDITNLEYIADAYSSSSTTCISTLEELWLMELPKLEKWWKDEVGEVPSFNSLTKLVIEDCPKLTYMPRIPNLKEGLVLDRICWKLFEQTMMHNTTAPSSSTYLPPLSNLKILRIVGIKDCKVDRISWDTMKNLIFLKFDCLPTLETLPNGLREVTSLQELHVWRCGIKKIPEWIDELQNLQKLVIHVCPLLEELPEEISKLPVLRTLEIEECNTLLRRCEERIGADWSKVSKIPERKFGMIYGR